MCNVCYFNFTQTCSRCSELLSFSPILTIVLAVIKRKKMFENVYSDTPRIMATKTANWNPSFYNGSDGKCVCHMTLNFPTRNRLDRPGEPPKTVSASVFYRLLKPYLSCMKMFGLFFIDEPPANGGLNTNRLYSRICLLLQFSSALFYGLPFLFSLEFESFTVVLLVACLWTMQNGFTAAISHNMCTQTHKFQRFFRNWSELIMCPSEQVEINAYVVRKRNVMLVLCWIFNIIFSLSWIVIMSGSVAEALPPEFKESVSPGLIKFMRILFCATHFYGSVAWTFPTGLFIVMCLSIRRILISYNAILSKAVDYILYGGLPSEISDPFKAEMFRIKHQKALRLVETTNNMFGLFILTMVLTNLSILCFASYMFLFVCSNPITKSLEAMWTVMSTLWLLLLAVTGAMLHSSAHKPYDDLHAVPLGNMSTDNVVKLIVFLNRVGGPEIGISAWGFSVLSKGFLSTLASMLLSYFFLLVQFQSPTGLSKCPEVIIGNRTI